MLLRSGFCRSVVILFLACGLASCGESTGNESSSVESREWVDEELLSRMQAIQKQNADIIDRLGQLEKKVSDLDIEVKAPPANEKPRQVVGQPAVVKFDPKKAKGAEEAAIAIVEYTDYQCPFCKRHSSQVLPQIMSEMVDSGKVRYEVADYPLSFHSAAKDAAISANCSGYQGKYWQMHDRLFEGQAKLGDAYYLEAAQQIGLDVDTFRKCVSNPSERKKVESSIEYANSIGVTGTPKFFVGRIDGEKIVDVKTISGAQGYQAFERAVAELLGTP
jgi:protein-disulfide isomerase